MCMCAEMEFKFIHGRAKNNQHLVLTFNNVDLTNVRCQIVIIGLCGLMLASQRHCRPINTQP